MENRKIIYSFIILFAISLFVIGSTGAIFYQDPTPEQPVDEQQVQENPDNSANSSDQTDQTTQNQGPMFSGVGDADLNILLELQTEIQTQPDPGQQMNWFTAGSDVSTWKGIKVENGQITEITLDQPGQSYFCTFPAAITKFPALRSLTIKNQGIYGAIPSELFEMPNLQILELSGNYFSGEIQQPNTGLYSPLLKLIISNNLSDPQNKDGYFANFTASCAAVLQQKMNEQPNIMTPGLTGSIPSWIAAFGNLQELNLSGNHLTGMIPDEFQGLNNLMNVNFSGNDGLSISSSLYQKFSTMTVDLSGVAVLEPTAAPVIETPTEVPTETAVPTEVPTETAVPTEVPTETAVPTEVPTDTAVPTMVPTDTSVPIVIPTDTLVPTEVPPLPVLTSTVIPTNMPLPTEKPVIPPTQVPYPTYTAAAPIVIVITATSVPVQPQWYTATPQYIRWVTATPQQQYWVTATPYNSYQPPVWSYPTPVPQYYPTSAPQYYPTSNSYPIRNTMVPTASKPTAVPTINPASQFNFTYSSGNMTPNKIPMTWKYTGMKEYMINYLDSSGTLYPAFGMQWTKAAEICNAATCQYNVSNIPTDLLKGGQFYIQLQAKDSVGRVYQSTPVGMKVSVPAATMTSTAPTHSKPTSLWGRILAFFFKLFGGGK